MRVVSLKINSCVDEKEKISPYMMIKIFFPNYRFSEKLFFEIYFSLLK